MARMKERLIILLMIALAVVGIYYQIRFSAYIWQLVIG